MTGLRAGLAVPADRAARYRAEGLWGGRRLADGIEAAAARRPRALALADNDRRCTYEELAGLVAAGIARLASHGVRAGDGVVLIAGNTAGAVVAYHALLRIGATIVLLDRRCGTADVRLALETLRGEVRVLVPAAERERLLADLAVGVVPLERFGSERIPDGRATWSEPDRDAPAIVLFTSGTTSRPKGVVHSLDTLTAGAANMARITAASEETVAFLVSPLTSIAGVMQMHLCADRHAALVLEDRFEPDATLDRIHALGATLLGGAPVIAERLLRAAAARGDRRIALRTVALGGAMLPRPLLDLASNEFGIETARVYGSSEAPNFSGSVPGDPEEKRLTDDGALMPGSEVRVGSANHPQEGMIRGASLFLGYVDPDDDAEAFEEGWYRTGDLIEVNGDRLTVIGRLKEVVTRSGLKISLAEIEAALAGLPGALEYACFVVPDSETGERLAVAVVPEEGTDGDPGGHHCSPAHPRHSAAEASRAARRVGRGAPAHRVRQSDPVAPDDGVTEEMSLKPSPEDHVAITDLLARYCLALDLDDIDGCVALFTPDACYEVYGRSFEGHDGLRKMMKSAPGGLHLGGPPVIEMVDRDHARTTQNALFVDRTSGASRSAVYTDELRRTENGWRIARRRCRFIVAGGLSDRPAS